MCSPFVLSTNSLVAQAPEHKLSHPEQSQTDLIQDMGANAEDSQSAEHGMPETSHSVGTDKSPPASQGSMNHTCNDEPGDGVQSVVKDQTAQLATQNRQYQELHGEQHPKWTSQCLHPVQ